MLPLAPLIPSVPFSPLVPLLPEKFAVYFSSYRTGMSSSACKSGWLGTVIVICGTFPSLILGSFGRDTTPFWLTVATVAVTLRSFHITFPWPAPSVGNILPSGSVTSTINGNFSPGAIAGPLSRVAEIDLTGVLSRETLQPIRTCTDAHPLSASIKATHTHPAQRIVRL